MMELKQIISKFDEKLDNLSDNVHSINITIAKQQENLAEHMRRTEVAEDRLEIFEKEITPALDAYKFVAISAKVIPVILTIVGIYWKYFT